MGGRAPLLCAVDLDSLCMLLRNDFKNAETGPQAEVWTGGVSSVISHIHLGCRSFQIRTARIGFVESEGHMYSI